MAIIKPVIAIKKMSMYGALNFNKKERSNKRRKGIKKAAAVFPFPEMML